MESLARLLDEARELYTERSARVQGLIDGSLPPEDGWTRDDEIAEITSQLMSISTILMRFG